MWNTSSLVYKLSFKHFYSKFIDLSNFIYQKLKTQRVEYMFTACLLRPSAILILNFQQLKSYTLFTRFVFPSKNTFGSENNTS